MIIYPYYAFVLSGAALAVFFFLLYVTTRQPLALICALLWVVPIGYEAWVLSTCTGECSIRVDLLLIFPLELLVLVGLSLFTWRAHKQRTNR